MALAWHARAGGEQVRGVMQHDGAISNVLNRDVLQPIEVDHAM